MSHVIRHLIWDVDGTLFDTWPAIVGSLGSAALERGAPATRAEVHDLALVSVDHCLETLSATYSISLDLLAGGFARHTRRIPPRTSLPSTEPRRCAGSGVSRC